MLEHLDVSRHGLLVIAKGSASSLTVASARDSRATIARRTGSARAMKARSSASSS